MALQSVETFKRFDASAFQRPVATDSFALAESLLVAGNLPAARRIAERLDDRSPDDPRILTLLGRIHLAWPVIGRFAAESLLTRAARLDSTNPEPFYWLGHVGLALGGDDGEMISRRGLLRVLAIDPSYRDAWALWERLYAGQGDRRAVVEALARHAGSDPADGFRAEVLVEMGEHAAALPLLAALAARFPDQVTPLVLMSRSYYEQGRDRDGWAAYERALEIAHLDTASILWRQIRSIATPAERELWAGTTPAQRAAFFRVFWTRRDPNLFSSGNERLGEHFRRMADAQRNFRILHPNSRYHRSPLYRSLLGVSGSSAELASLVRRAQQEQCTAGLPDSLVRLQYEQGLTPRLDSGNGEQSANMEDGLDDRGRVWVRHGRPTMRFTYGLDGETWCYARAEGTFRVTFIRRTGPFGHGGDVVFTPVVPGEVESARALMATDRAGIEYRLDFAFWHATFRSEDDLHTDVLIFPDSVRGIAALMDESGFEVARDSGTGRFLRIAAEPGRYLLMLDAMREDRMGSYRGPMPLPAYAGRLPTVSSLLIASGDVAPDRGSMAAAAPYGLRLPAGRPLRLYAELYDLGRRDNVSRFEARYRFQPIDDRSRPRGDEVIVSFQREIRYTSRITETLMVDPDLLAPGRYRVRLEIIDQIRATTAAGAAMEFQLR